MRNILIGIAIAVGLMVVVFMLFSNPPPGVATHGLSSSYSEFVADLDAGKIEEVTVQGAAIFGRFKTGGIFQTRAPSTLVLPALTDRLLAKKVTVTARPVEEDRSYAAQWIATLLVQGVFFAALWWFMGRPLAALVRQLDAYVTAMHRDPGAPPPQDRG